MTDLLGTTSVPASILGSIVRLDSRGEIIQRWKIRDRKCTIGSHRDSAIHIDDANLHPCHAVIVFGTQHVILKALASSVLLNQYPLREAVLGPGDVIDIGTVRLRVESVTSIESAGNATNPTSNFETDGPFRDLELAASKPRPTGSQRVSGPIRFSNAPLFSQRVSNEERIDTTPERSLPLNSTYASKSVDTGAFSPELLTTCIDRFSQSMIGALERWNEQLDQRLRSITPAQNGNLPPAAAISDPAASGALSQPIAADGSQSLLTIQRDFEKRVQRMWRKQRRWFIEQQEQLKNNLASTAASLPVQQENPWKGAHETTMQQIEGLVTRLDQIEIKIETIDREIPAVENVIQEYQARQDLRDTVALSSEEAEKQALLQQRTDNLAKDLEQQRQLSQSLVDQVERLAEQLLKANESTAKPTLSNQNEDLTNDLNMLRVRQELIESEIGRLDGELDSLKLQSTSNRGTTTNLLPASSYDASTDEDESATEDYWQPASLNEENEEELETPYPFSNHLLASESSPNASETEEQFQAFNSSSESSSPSTNLSLWRNEVANDTTLNTGDVPESFPLPGDANYSPVNDVPVQLSGESFSLPQPSNESVYPSWMNRPEGTGSTNEPPYGVSPLFGNTAASTSDFTSQDSTLHASLESSEPFDLSSKFTGSWFKPELDSGGETPDSTSEDTAQSYLISQPSSEDDTSAWQPSQSYQDKDAIGLNSLAIGASLQEFSSTQVEQDPSIVETDNENSVLQQQGLSALESLRAELASLYEKEDAEAAANKPLELFPKRSDSLQSAIQTRPDSEPARGNHAGSPAFNRGAVDVGHSREPHSSDEDQSVEHYMQQLLARMRGEAVAQPAQPAPQKETVPPPAPTKTMREVRTQPMAISTPNKDSIGGMEIPLNRLSEKLEETKLNRVAAETGVNLEAFRELANHSARTAIQSSIKKKVALPHDSKLIVAFVSLLSGLGLFAYNGPKVNLFLIAAFFAVSVGLVWGWDAIQSRHAKPKA